MAYLCLVNKHGVDGTRIAHACVPRERMTTAQRRSTREEKFVEPAYALMKGDRPGRTQQKGERERDRESVESKGGIRGKSRTIH